MSRISSQFFFQAKCNDACLEREEVTEQNSKMKIEICGLKEILERREVSNRIEVTSWSKWLWFIR